MNRRTLTSVVAVLTAAVVSLGGCQSKMGAAAYVGDQRITEEDLDRATDAGQNDPDIRRVIDEADPIKGDLAAYRRLILRFQVRHLLLAEAARRLSVSVSDAEVDEQVDDFVEQAGGDPKVAFAQGLVTEPLGREVLRDELLRSRIGFEAGGIDSSDAQLRRQYEQNREQYTTMTLGVVRVPDAGTAQQVSDSLRANPGGFEDLAAQYPGPDTTPTPQSVMPQDLNQELAALLADRQSGDVVLFQLPDQGVFAVIYLVKREVAPFEAVRGQILSNGQQAADQAAARYLSELARDLGVRINPRYGSWNAAESTISDLSDPLVDLAGTVTPTEPAPAPPQN